MTGVGCVRVWPASTITPAVLPYRQIDADLHRRQQQDGTAGRIPFSFAEPRARVQLEGGALAPQPPKHVRENDVAQDSQNSSFERELGSVAHSQPRRLILFILVRDLVKHFQP